MRLAKIGTSVFSLCIAVLDVFAHQIGFAIVWIIISMLWLIDGLYNS